MISLTRQERRVVLFLMIVVLSGTAIDYVRKQCAPLRAAFCLEESYGKININSADKEAMKEISGIGDTIAQRIIDYRRANGPFDDIEDLRNVKGLEGSRYERIKEAICVE
ncbi:MAG: ComEA family DNA-binding protein [Candidatus Omnitrophota bacterium]